MMMMMLRRGQGRDCLVLTWETAEFLERGFRFCFLLLLYCFSGAGMGNDRWIGWEMESMGIGKIMEAGGLCCGWAGGW